MQRFGARDPLQITIWLIPLQILRECCGHNLRQVLVNGCEGITNEQHKS